MPFHFEPRNMKYYLITIKVKESLNVEDLFDKKGPFSGRLSITSILSTGILNEFLVTCILPRPTLDENDVIEMIQKNRENIISIECEIMQIV